MPNVVVTDGSSLYPPVLAELWPLAHHQLCIFHILQDINDLIIKSVRRLAHAMSRRGNAGRKRKRGRPNKAQQAARCCGWTDAQGEGELHPQASFPDRQEHRQAD